MKVIYFPPRKSYNFPKNVTIHPQFARPQHDTACSIGIKSAKFFSYSPVHHRYWDRFSPLWYWYNMARRDRFSQLVPLLLPLTISPSCPPSLPSAPDARKSAKNIFQLILDANSHSHSHLPNAYVDARKNAKIILSINARHQLTLKVILPTHISNKYNKKSMHFQ